MITTGRPPATWTLEQTLVVKYFTATALGIISDSWLINVVARKIFKKNKKSLYDSKRVYYTTNYDPKTLFTAF